MPASLDTTLLYEVLHEATLANADELVNDCIILYDLELMVRNGLWVALPLCAFWTYE